MRGFVRLSIGLSLLASFTCFQLHLLLKRQVAEVQSLMHQYPVVDSKSLSVQFLEKPPARWTALPMISPWVQKAVIVSEDWDFYHHRGYDPFEITEAFRKDLKEARYVRGASTITQQLVKNLFLGKKKNLLRKVRELLLSVQVEQTLSKARILEIYLNIVEWGPEIYGIQEASKFYFNKSPLSISPREGAFLAMLLPSPVRYGQSFRKKRLTAYAQKMVQGILEKMVRARALSDDEFNKEIQENFDFENKDVDPGPQSGENQ